MNIKQLEYFVNTAQEGSFSAAARKLFVAPQAVSRAVLDLEHELKIPLCQRNSRPVELTSFGELFYHRSSEIVASMADLTTLAQNEANSCTAQGSLSLAIAGSLLRGKPLSPESFAPFEKSNPLVKLNLSFCESGSALSAVEEGSVDAGIIYGRTAKPSVSCTKFQSLKPRVMLDGNHPLAHKEELTMSDLHNYPLAAPEDIRYCRKAVSRQTRALGYQLTYALVPQLLEAHKNFLTNERGLMFVVPTQELKALYPFATTIPVSTKELVSLPLCLVYRKDHQSDIIPLLEQYLVGAYMRDQRKLTH